METAGVTAEVFGFIYSKFCVVVKVKTLCCGINIVLSFSNFFKSYIEVVYIVKLFTVFSIKQCYN